MSARLPLRANVPLPLIAAVVVWTAGSQVPRYAAHFQRQTGIGETLVGMLLLSVMSIRRTACVLAAYVGRVVVPHVPR